MLKPAQTRQRLRRSVAEIRELIDPVSAGLARIKVDVESLDGFARSGDAVRSSGSTSDPTGNLAASGRLNHLMAELDRLERGMRDITNGALELRRFSARFAPPIEQSAPMCGDVSPGAIRREWPNYDAACRRYASTYPRIKGGPGVRWQGLCDGCLKRFGRWCREAGREEDAYRDAS